MPSGVVAVPVGVALVVGLAVAVAVFAVGDLLWLAFALAASEAAGPMWNVGSTGGGGRVALAPGGEAVSLRSPL